MSISYLKKKKKLEKKNKQNHKTIRLYDNGHIRRQLFAFYIQNFELSKIFIF